MHFLLGVDMCEVKVGKFKDLSGKKFGKWTVLRRTESSRSGHTRFECICECGNVKNVLSTHLIRGNSNHCGCYVLRGPEHPQWKGHGEISADFWDSIKRGADGRKGRRTAVSFDITIQQAWDLFEAQSRRCALTGLALVMGQRHNHLRTASLDRIDNSKGYTIDNVQWLHKDINRMKGTFDEKYFIDMCCKVANGGACEI